MAGSGCGTKHGEEPDAFASGHRAGRIPSFFPETEGSTSSAYPEFVFPYPDLPIPIREGGPFPLGWGKAQTKDGPAGPGCGPAGYAYRSEIDGQGMEIHAASLPVGDR